jgi:hypothetical protein
MEASRNNPALAAARIDELQRENETLKEQVRALAVQQNVVRGALSEAHHEKEATARIAHQVTVEERATRTAVEVQNNSLSFAVVMQMLNFFVLVVLAAGLFVWLPREMERRVSPPTTIVTPGSTVIPR